MACNRQPCVRSAARAAVAAVPDPIVGRMLASSRGCRPLTSPSSRGSRSSRSRANARAPRPANRGGPTVQRRTRPGTVRRMSWRTASRSRAPSQIQRSSRVPSVRAATSRSSCPWPRAGSGTSGATTTIPRCRGTAPRASVVRRDRSARSRSSRAISAGPPRGPGISKSSRAWETDS